MVQAARTSRDELKRRNRVVLDRFKRRVQALVDGHEFETLHLFSGQYEGREMMGIQCSQSARATIRMLGSRLLDFSSTALSRPAFLTVSRKAGRESALRTCEEPARTAMFTLISGCGGRAVRRAGLMLRRPSGARAQTRPVREFT